jgi:1-acyl-sn-glycerol-3-phosphate acyltransferase
MAMTANMESDAKDDRHKSERTRESLADKRTLYGRLQHLFYYSVRTVATLSSVLLFDLRCIGRPHMDVKGGALVLSTHQSLFDPVLVGITFNERLNYLAKRSLFQGKLFGAFISLLNAIELDRDRSGLAGLKETLKRLRSGQKVLIFPEGTRSPDGQLMPLMPGFLVVARRSGVPLIPVAITGAYDALPRGARWPRCYPLRVAVGPAITAEQVANLDDTDLLQLVSERLRDCFQQAQASRA